MGKGGGAIPRPMNTLSAAERRFLILALALLLLAGLARWWWGSRAFSEMPPPLEPIPAPEPAEN